MRRSTTSLRSKSIHELIENVFIFMYFIDCINILSIRNDRKISNLDLNYIINPLVRRSEKEFLFSGL